MQGYGIMFLGFFSLYMSSLSFSVSLSALHFLIVSTEASDISDFGGDHTAPPILHHPDCTASEGVLYHLPQCHTLWELLTGMASC